MSPLWGRAAPIWPKAATVGANGVPSGVTVKVRRREITSRPGSTTPTFGPWSSATEHEVEGVGLDRTGSSALIGESGDDELQTSTLWAPTGADIVLGDRVIYPSGVIVTVDGIPNREPNMINGWLPPMSVPVKVTYG